MLGSTTTRKQEGSSTSSPGHCRSDPEGIWYSSCYTRVDTSTRHQLNDSAWLDCRRLSLWLVWSPLWWVRWWLLWTISRGAVYWEVSHLKSEHAAPFQSDESVEQPPPVEQPVNSKSPWGLEGSCQNSSQQKKNATSIMAPQSHIIRPTTPGRMRSRSWLIIILWCQISQKSNPSSSSSAPSGHDIIVWRSALSRGARGISGDWYESCRNENIN